MYPVGETVFVDLTETIVHAIKPQQVILFGSYARGTAGPDSDIDLLIIVEQPFSASRSRRQTMARLWRLLAHIAAPKDLLLYSCDEVEQWRHTQNHIIARALREGKVLYERA